jgi:hypothetical protein
MSENNSREKEKESCQKSPKDDAFSGVIGGLIVILLGVMFLLATMDIISWGKWWAYFLLGLGAILILDGIIRSATTAYRHHARGRLIGGAVLAVIGGAFVFGMSNWWPLIIIAVGIVLVVSSLAKIK